MLAIVRFDLGEHAREMLRKHPDMTDRQTRNVLYWQSSVNKQLAEHAQWVINEYFGHGYAIFTICPEAMGVQVIKTAQRSGLPIEPRPRDMVHKIALVGYPARIK